MCRTELSQSVQLLLLLLSCLMASAKKRRNFTRKCNLCCLQRCVQTSTVLCNAASNWKNAINNMTIDRNVFAITNYEWRTVRWWLKEIRLPWYSYGGFGHKLQKFHSFERNDYLLAGWLHFHWMYFIHSELSRPLMWLRCCLADR